jgi:hypothetical protein
MHFISDGRGNEHLYLEFDSYKTSLVVKNYVDVLKMSFPSFLVIE